MIGPKICLRSGKGVAKASMSRWRACDGAIIARYLLRPMDTPVDVRSPRKAAIAFIFAIVLLDVIALGIVIPVLPKLIETMLGGDTPRAAEIFGIFGTS